MASELYLLLIGTCGPCDGEASRCPGMQHASNVTNALAASPGGDSGPEAQVRTLCQTFPVYS